MANLGDILTVPSMASPQPIVVPTSVGGSGFGDNGLISAIVLSSLLGGRGFGNDKHSDNSEVCNAITTNEILSAIGDVKASVPLAEGQVQLALAGLSDQLTRTITNGQTALMQGQHSLQLQEANSTSAVQAQLAANTAAVLAGLNNVDTNVDRSACQIINAIRDDGNATRAAINAIEHQRVRDERLILANQLAELTHERNRDRDRHGVEVTMINNQNQNQLQWQEQRFENERFRNQLWDASQYLRATNQAINIGAGTLTSTPVNTNNQVRA